ncbi:MAG: hypothetical protein HXS50_04460 [Theionarchaea archaeon]|nr:hypothetical protein [Theionarchaea archaeon]
MNTKTARASISPPSESEKHRLLVEIFQRIDQITEVEVSRPGAYFLKMAKKGGTTAIYDRAWEIYTDLEERIRKNPGEVTLNGTGLYRTALRLAVIAIADDQISELRSEVLSWGFDELAPITGADLDMGSDIGSKASGIAVPIDLR